MPTWRRGDEARGVALRGSGAGELIKNGGENTILEGLQLSLSRICFRTGGIVKVVSDAGPEVETVRLGYQSELPR